MDIPQWNITEMTGYEPKTTFWMDFSIADKFGIDAIKDTYNRVMKEWNTNHIYMTELAMVINWKCWDTYYKLLDWIEENLKGNELTYFYNTID